MLQILIVRHASPIYETDSITEEGEKQAIQLAERITRLEKIDALYVSPLGRATGQQSISLRLRALSEKSLTGSGKLTREIVPGRNPITNISRRK